VTETTDSAVLAAGLEPQNPQGLGNNDTLLLVVGSGNTLERLQALHGGLTAGGLVRNHAADGSPEHLGGGAEVEGTWPGELAHAPNMDDASSRTRVSCVHGEHTTTSGVVTGLLAQESRVLHCVILSAIFVLVVGVCPGSKRFAEEQPQCTMVDHTVILSMPASHCNTLAVVCSLRPLLGFGACTYTLRGRTRRRC